MNRKYRTLKITLFFLLTAAFFSSCTLGRIVYYFRPNLNDHKKQLFVCDTISAHSAKDNFQFARTEHNAQLQLPPIEEWIPLSERLQAKDLDDFFGKTKTTSFLIIRNDSILYEKYFKGTDPNQSQVVFSVTKAICATLTAVLAEKKILDLETAVHEILPDFPFRKDNPIRIRHLMDMTSGIDWSDFKDIAALGVLYYTQDIEAYVKRKMAFEAEPDDHFVYASISTQLLGLCIERVCKDGFAKVLNEHIWQYIGAENRVLITLDDKDRRKARTFGGMAISPRDIARFARLMLNGGNWSGRQIVPQSFIQKLEARDPNTFFMYTGSYWKNGYESAGFRKNRQYAAAGFGGQFMFVSPNDNCIIIRTGKKEKIRWNMILGRLMERINYKHNDMTDPSLDHAASFAGTYVDEKGRSITLKELDKRDRFGRKQWQWERDTESFDVDDKIHMLYQFDGISMGYKKSGFQIRMYFDRTDEGTKGFFYNASPSTKMFYFRKK